MGLVVMALLLLPRLGRAHTPGLSLADFDVQPGGRVHARLTFATADAFGGASLDRDGDGVVTGEEVSAARADLQAFTLQGVSLVADGTSSCAATFESATLSESDGLVLEASYRCPEDAAEFEAVLYYLSALPRGKQRGICRIAAGSDMIEGVLDGDHRSIRLRLPDRPGVGARRSSRRVRAALLLAAAAAVAAAVVAAYRSYRWRSARATWQNRAP